MTSEETFFEMAANNMGKGIQGDLGALVLLEPRLAAFPSDLPESETGWLMLC